MSPPTAFAELWRLARCQRDGTVEVQVHEVRPPIRHGLAVVVRCVGGLVRVGSRFDRVRETGVRLDLSVARIAWHDREPDRLSRASPTRR